MDFDIVKVEKLNAMARYNRFRRIAKIWQMLEVAVALALFSWSSTRLPALVRFTGGCLVEFSVNLVNTHVAFLIGNAIVLALFVISRGNGDDNVSSADRDYDEYVRNTDDQKSVSPASDTVSQSNELQTPSAEVVPEEKNCDDDAASKQIVCSENVTCQSQCDAAASAIEQATKQIQRFKRTKSEKLKREIAVKPDRELRRSETVVRRLVTSSSADRRPIKPLDTVENLSNEEFRLTIEAFIEKHQKFLWAQKMIEQNQ